MDDPSTWRWIWLGATAVFAAGEMATAGTFFLAPFAVGAAVATLLAFFDVSVVVQWVVFVAVSAATFAGFRPLARRLDRAPAASVGATRFARSVATVIEPIPEEGVGLVQIDREEWRAESHNRTPLPVGTRVTVVEVRGTRLIVTST